MSESPAKGVNRPIPVPPRSRARQAPRSDDGDTSIGDDKNMLEGLLREKSAAHDALETQLRDMTAAREALEKDLNEKNSAFSALENELNEIKKAQSELESKLSEKSAAFDSLEKQLAEKSAAHKDLALSASQKDSSYEALVHDAESRHTQHDELLAQLAERDEQLTEAARQLDSSATAHETLVSDLQEQLRTANEAHGNTKAEMERQLAAAEEKATALQSLIEENARSHAAEIAELNKEVDSASSARDDVTKQSALWIDELENLRTQHSELTERVGNMKNDERIGKLEARVAELEEERNAERQRADDAEDRVRDLRFTAEESRRAIMRLQESEARVKANKYDKREDEDTVPKHARRSSLVGRALSLNDEEEKPSGLRGLKLSGAATSPTLDSNTPTMGHTKDTTEEDASHASISRPLSIFNSSILRPTFGLRRKNDDERSVKTDVVEAKVDAAREQEEKDSIEISSLRRQIRELQDQLMESREAVQAGEVCIHSLREYIVQSQGGGPGHNAPAGPAPQLPKRRVPSVPVPGPQETEAKAPECEEPKNEVHGTEDPETKDPETKDPETNGPETKDPEIKDTETKDPESKDNEANEHGSNEAEVKEPEVKEPLREEPQAEPKESDPAVESIADSPGTTVQDNEVQDDAGKNVERTSDAPDTPATDGEEFTDAVGQV